MNWEDIKEQSIEQLNVYKDKLVESSLYIQLKERYDQYPPKTQKIINYCAGFLIVYFVFSIPFSYLGSAADSIDKFELRKSSLIRFLKLQADKQNMPAIPPYVPASSLVARAKSLLQAEGVSEDQIVSVESFVSTTEDAPSYIPREASVDGVRAKLSKLNLTQVLDINFRLGRLNRGSLLSHLSILRNEEQDHYYDIEIELRSYDIPSEDVAVEESAPTRNTRRKK